MAEPVRHAYPPRVDLLGEDREGGVGIDVDPGRHADRRRTAHRLALGARARALDVFPERRELLRPERLDLVEPGLQHEELLGPEPVHPLAGVGGRGRGFDQTAEAQDPEVTAHRGARHSDPVGELAGASRAVAQQLDDAPAGGVGEGGERRVDVGHAANSSRFCIPLSRAPTTVFRRSAQPRVG